MKRLLLLFAFFICLAGFVPAKASSEYEELVSALVKQRKAFHDRMVEDWNRRNEEIRLIAEVIYWENWFTDEEKLAARYTGAVVLNRVKDKWFPNTIKEVLYQKGQYSTTKYFFTKELPGEVYELARDIYYNGTPDVPDGVLFQAMRPLGKVWKKINTDYFCYGGK